MKASPICGIYKITSPSGRIYIGKSTDCNMRKYIYSGLCCKNQPQIYASLKKYGWKNHTYEIIEICKEEYLNYYEIYYIWFYGTYNSRRGMNCTTGGGIGSKGTKHSEIVKQKISIGNSGKIVSIETRDQIRKSLIGVKHTEERRKNISKSLTGRKATEEHKKNISVALKGDKNPLFGKKHTQIHIQKLINNHSRRRTVINTQNGIFYFDVKDAADSMGINYKTLRGKLLKIRRNNTPFIYA